MRDIVSDFVMIAVLTAVWVVATEFLGMWIGSALWAVVCVATLTRME